MHVSERWQISHTSEGKNQSHNRSMRYDFTAVLWYKPGLTPTDCQTLLVEKLWRSSVFLSKTIKDKGQGRQLTQRKTEILLPGEKNNKKKAPVLQSSLQMCAGTMAERQWVGVRAKVGSSAIALSQRWSATFLPGKADSKSLLTTVEEGAGAVKLPLLGCFDICYTHQLFLNHVIWQICWIHSQFLICKLSCSVTSRNLCKWWNGAFYFSLYF